MNARGLALALLGPVIGRAGRAYLAGPSRTEALAVARHLTGAGHAVTLAYWNHPEDSPADVVAEYLAAVHDVAGLGRRPMIAVKAPTLGFDPAAVRRLADAARGAEVGLLFDAHAPEDADATLRLAEAAADAGATSGVALPARWARSRDDAGSAAARGLRLRLVKGQWADDAPGAGAAGEGALRSAFLRLAELAGGLDTAVAVATHDARLVAEVLARPEGAATRELELLLGFPAARLLRGAAAHAVPVRFYVPYGSPGLAFKLSAVFRRPRLAMLLTRGVLLGRANQRIRLRQALAARPVAAPERAGRRG